MLVYLIMNIFIQILCIVTLIRAPKPTCYLEICDIYLSSPKIRYCKLLSHPFCHMMNVSVINDSLYKTKKTLYCFDS